MSAELLLIFFVALLAFSPSKLPMLAQHIGKLVRRLEQLKQQMYGFLQLQENTNKAEKADKEYTRNLSKR
jgi:sec-independent protein translocase protein TatB